MTLAAAASANNLGAHCADDSPAHDLRRLAALYGSDGPGPPTRSSDVVSSAEKRESRTLSKSHRHRSGAFVSVSTCGSLARANADGQPRSQ